MSTRMKVLLLEDNATDAELIQRVLNKENLDCEYLLVMEGNKFEQALRDYRPTVVLSDNSLPSFNSLEALKATRRYNRFIPFILVTGTVSEEYAANIIKEGADDYILKDRLIRLPAAIRAALNQRTVEKEIADYKFAMDQASIVAITDQKGIIKYANENFSKISKYSIPEIIGQDHRFINSGYHPASFFKQLWQTIANGNIWKGEICNRAKDGSIYWVDTTIIPFLNEENKPYQYLAIRSDITEKKKLEENLAEQIRNEQLRIISIALEAQEKERNLIGQELHDNVNQILVGTKLLLSIAKSNPEKLEAVLASCIKNLQEAIEENRKIAHTLVTPDLGVANLAEQMKLLTGKMLNTGGISVYIDTEQLDESLLTDEHKLAAYRIAQEQCSNIIKYANATQVDLMLRTTDDVFNMTINDNGIGADTNKKTNGIGLRNIKGRLTIFNGAMTISTSPGKGFSLSVLIPLRNK